MPHPTARAVLEAGTESALPFCFWPTPGSKPGVYSQLPEGGKLIPAYSLTCGATMTNSEPKPVGTGTLLTQTLCVFRSKFPIFLGLAAALPIYLAVVLLPTVLIQIGLNESASGIPPSGASEPWTASEMWTALSPRMRIIWFIEFTGSLLIAWSSVIGTVFVTSDIYAGRPTGIVQAWRRIRIRNFRLYLVMWIAGLIPIVGPLIALCCFISVPTAILEHLKTIAAFDRTKVLMIGSYGRILLGLLLYIVLSLLVIIPWAIGMEWLFGWPPWLRIPLFLSSFAFILLPMQLFMIFLTLIYYKQHALKEQTPATS